jgi:toxin ParE1/3/4
MNIDWSLNALENLEQIIEYISQDSEINAKKFAGKITDKVLNISLLPKVGRPVPEAKDKTVREVFLKKYRIIYQQLPDGIKVISIIHGYRNISDPLEP